jgi:predicted DNA-binding protein (UPF0251 family)
MAVKERQDSSCQGYAQDEKDRGYERKAKIVEIVRQTLASNASNAKSKMAYRLGDSQANRA